MQTGTRPPVTADVTRQLARHIATSRYADRPARAVAVARRGVLDWLGYAMAAKFMRNAEPVIGRERATRVCKLTASLKKTDRHPRAAAPVRMTPGRLALFPTTDRVTPS